MIRTGYRTTATDATEEVNEAIQRAAEAKTEERQAITKEEITEAIIAASSRTKRGREYYEALMEMNKRAKEQPNRSMNEIRKEVEKETGIKYTNLKADKINREFSLIGGLLEYR